MSDFVLDSQLEKDSIFIRNLGLSQLRLHNQKDVPWIILVPKRPDVSEIHDLNVYERSQLMEEITRASLALTHLYNPKKINVGAFGNFVPQLHVHVIARFVTDIAWPSPIWGRLKTEPHDKDALVKILAELNDDKWWG